MAIYARRAAWTAAVIAAAFFSLRPAVANPGCSIGDIAKAAKDTFNNVPLSCAPQAANPFFYPLVGYTIALLQTPEGVEFCNAAEGLQSSASDAQKQIAGYWGKLSADQQQKLKDAFPAAADLSSGASDVSGALNIVSCACQTAQWKGPGDLAGDLGSCASDALCAMDNWLHDHVWSGFGDCSSGTPPPVPHQVDCRPSPKKQNPDPPWNWTWDDSIGYVGSGNNCGAGPHGDNGYQCQGDICVTTASPPYQGSGGYCYCPKVMQGWDQYGFDNGECIGFLTCSCPGSSQPLSPDPKQAASYICVCPDSGLPVNDDGSCPPPPPKCEPSCPAGQVSKITSINSCSYSCDCPDGLTKAGDKCVTPCADASQVMLANGTCCAAAQANSCGTCCPTGMKPDSTGQSCITPLLPPKGAFTPLKLPLQPQKKL